MTEKKPAEQGGPRVSAKPIINASAPARNPLLAAALDYAERGWRVLPLHGIGANGRCTCGETECSSPGKHPLIKWKAEASTDADTVRRWWSRWPSANVAVATGPESGLLVLDVDDLQAGRNLGREEWRIAAERALVAVTGRGAHLYFSWPPELDALKTQGARLRPGLDVRGRGGYVVAPPSTHASGKVYQWVAERGPDGREPGPPPEWVLDLLRERRPAAVNGAQRPDVPGEWDIPAAGTDWAAVEREGVEAGGRNDALARLVGHLLADGVDPAEAIERARAFAGRCRPPMDAGEIERTVASIARKELEARGVEAPPEDLDELVAALREHPRPGTAGGETGGWPPPLDLRALAARDPEPPPMIIDDWLPAGYATMLAGHGGAGKSAIALQLAAHMALGRPWCRLPVEQRRVLYLSCEDRERVLHWRLRRICDHAGIDMAELAGRLVVLDLVGHDAILYGRDPMIGSGVTLAYHELARLIEQTGAEAVVLDGVTDTYGESENDRAEVKRFVNALVRLIPEGRGAVLLVAHVNKATASAGSSSEGYSGSTGWHNAVRARWYLRPEIVQGDEGVEATGDLLLELQKSNLGASDQTIRYRWDDDARTFTGWAESISPYERLQQEAQEREGILAALHSVVDSGDYVPAAVTGSRTAFSVLSASEKFPKTLRSGSASRRRFWRHIEVLRRRGAVAEGSIRRANRHDTLTLVPKTAPAQAASHASHE